MIAVKYPDDPSDGDDRVIDLSSASISQRDCALYIMEMSRQLSRMADAGALPEVVGFCLDIVAGVAQQRAAELDAHRWGLHLRSDA